MEELRTLMPQTDSPVPALSALEKLPYVTATITEGLRISHGTAGRMVRTAPDEDLYYHGLKIPRGTTILQSHYLLHTNAAAFPDPHGFRPERFLREGAAKAQRHTVPFGRGARMCLGMHLAWSEMYLTIAVLLTSVRMELVETSIWDATMESEYFVGCLPKKSKGIRVRVHENP